MPKPKQTSAFATRVLRVRVKDKHAAALRAMAVEVNLVWNYCNALSAKVLEREHRFLSAFELQKFLNGALYPRPKGLIP